jgi:hypothetical protein
MDTAIPNADMFEMGTEKIMDVMTIANNRRMQFNAACVTIDIRLNI